MVEKLAERREREIGAIKGSGEQSCISQDRMVSDKELFRQLGGEVQILGKS